jgi:hypothetical protein
MNTVSAENLLPGMVLAADLKDLAGRTLLKEGAELSERYIERIRKWGFGEIAVQGEGDEGLAGALPPVVGYPVEGRSWAEIQADVEKRFSKSGNDYMLVRLKRAVLTRVKELAEIYAGL